MVLAPNGNEQYGLIANRWTFEATSWEMSIDFEMDYSSDMAAYSKSSYQIYFAAHVPEALRRKDFKDFG